MANETQKPDGGKKAVWLWTIAAIIVLLVLFVWWKVPKPTFAGSKSAEIATVQLHFGDTIVDFSTKWMAEPIKNVSGSIISHAHPLTKGVIYQVMIDDDTNKVYTFPPIDAPKSTTGTNMFNYTSMWSIARYRIFPGQSKTMGKFLYTRDPG